MARGLPIFGDYAVILREWILFDVAKVGEVSNVAQVAQICKGEMAERRSEETILAESLSLYRQEL